MQVGTAAGFTDTPVLFPLLHSGIWIAGLAVVSFGAFTWRSRVHLDVDQSAQPDARPVPTGS